LNLIEALNKIKEYNQKGLYHSSLEIIHTLYEDKLHRRNLLEIKLLEAQIDLRLGLFNDAFDLASRFEVESRKQNQLLFEIDFLFIKIDSLLKLMKLGEILELISICEKLLTDNKKIAENERKSRLGKLYLYKGNFYRIKGENKIYRDESKKALAIFEELNEPDNIANALFDLGFYYRLLSNYKKSLEYYFKALSIEQELANVYPIATILKHIGITYSLLGEPDKALNYYSQSMQYFREMKNDIDIAKCYNNIGIVYESLGELPQALDNFQLAIMSFMEAMDSVSVAYLKYNIGSIYLKMGYLNEALEYTQFALGTFQEIGNIIMIAGAFNNIGRIYQLKGDYIQALVFLQSAYQFKDKVESMMVKTRTMYYLTSITIETMNLELANIYLLDLEAIDLVEKNPIISQRTKFCQALILKTNDIPQSTSNAKEMFYQIINEDIKDHEVVVDSYLQLVELLMKELLETKNDKIILELEDLLKDLTYIAQNQRSNILLVKTLCAKSKIKLIQLYVEEAIDLLSESENLVLELGLIKLTDKINNELNKLIDKKESWLKLNKNQISLADIINKLVADGLATCIIKN